MTWRDRRRARKAARAAVREAARAPKPPCGVSDVMYRWKTCDLPEGHAGDHGRIIGRSNTKGGLVERTSVTREMWPNHAR